MELGGAERALLGLLYAIDPDRFDVDLFINQHTGPFMKYIPKTVHLLPEMPVYGAIERPIKEILKKGHFHIAYRRMISKFKYHRYLRQNHLENDGTFMQFLYDSVIDALPSLFSLGQYDLAISFIDPPHIVQDKVRALKKIEWIHTDFSGAQFHYDCSKTYDRWAANDFIISISDEVSRSFIKSFPSLSKKIVKIENIIPYSMIIKQSQEYGCLEYDKSGSDCFNICSVGRLSYQKNFDNIPRIALLINKKMTNYHWWIIGPGNTEEYNQMAAELGVSNQVSFIGSRENPYPYMANCDLYVQPSRYEGKAITVQEAQMLSKPVLITRYPTSSSQIIDGEDGFICEMDNESVASSIVRLSQNPAILLKVGQRAAQMHTENDSEIEILYNLIYGNT